MDDVFIYVVPLPLDVKEMVIPCLNGYTVYINSALDDAHQLQAYNHALYHIKHNDFEKYDVQEIEYNAHKGE